MKRIALSLIQASGAFALARAISAGMPRILMYHNFSAAEKPGSADVSVPSLLIQLRHLQRHFQILSLAELIEQLRSQGRFARNAAVLTIDDGRRNCFEFLFPLLQELRLPATFFVVSSFIEGLDWIWTDKVLWLSQQQNPPEELRPSGIDELFARLIKLPPPARNERIGALAAAMDVSIPSTAPSEYEPCSWAELRQMADSGLVEIGSHTVTHPIMSTIGDQESWTELTYSKTTIEKALGKEIRFFCFPNGKPGDYRRNQLQQVEDAGYEAAVVTSFGLVRRSSNRYELPRVGVSGPSDLLSFEKYVDGAEHYQAKIEKSLGLRNAAC
jgi:peptidoglycan/xylan/chitin deacetylase (PgdA/CDA1 family)